MSVVLPSIHDPKLIELLNHGSVGVLPTDTVYGLAAAAGNQSAVTRLYALKDRERKPGTIIAASVEQLIELGLDATTLQAVKRLWPNPLSIVIPVTQTGYLDQEIGSLAVRIPKSDEMRSLLTQTGPLLTTSANRPGEPPANTLPEAEAYFTNRVDFYVDGGDRSGLPPSTIVRYDNGQLEVLRVGAVTINDKGEVV